VIGSIGVARRKRVKTQGLAMAAEAVARPFFLVRSLIGCAGINRFDNTCIVS